MRGILRVVGAFVGVTRSLNAQSAQTELSIAEIAAKARSAVVTIHVANAQGARIGQGSGFIAPDGRVVTNRHVIEGAARAEIFGSEGQILGVAPYVEAMSSEMDLAILPALSEAPGRLAVSRGLPAVGVSVVVLGAPQGLENTVSEGIISAWRSLSPGRLLQLTAAISPGSSGGPVLNRLGEVVGVATSQLSEGQNLNFAVPAEAIRAVLGSPASKIPFPPARLATSGSRTDGSAQHASSEAAPRASTTNGLELGARWTVTSRNDKVAIGIDTSHSAVDEHLHRFYAVWYKVAYAKPQPLENGKQFSSSIGRQLVDCRDRRSRMVSFVAYDDMTAVANGSFPNAPFEQPIPDSVGEGIINGVCTVLRGR